MGLQFLSETKTQGLVLVTHLGAIYTVEITEKENGLTFGQLQKHSKSYYGMGSQVESNVITYVEGEKSIDVFHAIFDNSLCKFEIKSVNNHLQLKELVVHKIDSEIASNCYCVGLEKHTVGNKNILIVSLHLGLVLLYSYESLLIISD